MAGFDRILAIAGWQVFFDPAFHYRKFPHYLKKRPYSLRWCLSLRKAGCQIVPCRKAGRRCSGCRIRGSAARECPHHHIMLKTHACMVDASLDFPSSAPTGVSAMRAEITPVEPDLGHASVGRTSIMPDLPPSCWLPRAAPARFLLRTDARWDAQ